ncbi:MAG: HAMP domain-containing sensor histidine kinase [Bryobacteraceae bacterium]
MVVVGRRKSVGIYIALGVVLISLSLILYGAWIANLREVSILVLGGLLLLALIAGMVLNTFFLVRQIRRNEQQDAFINAVTHELKTPVASIRLYLETLQSRDVDEAKRKEFYSTMLDDSDRLLSTIEQVLRTGRVGSSSSRKPHLSEFDLDVLVDECVNRARTSNQLSEAAITFKAGLGATVMADHEEIRAAVSNLIDNAIKYSGKSVSVKVETASIEGDQAIVRVRDQGSGIPQTELKDIFKRFHRVPGPTARIPGTGLGLFIVRSVAKRHGGRAWAESEGLGQGSTFVLQLPLAK